MAYCKISEISAGTLHLTGDGFKLSLSYNPKIVTPKIEFYEVTDGRLKKYWPEGISRIVFEINNPGLKGATELTLKEVR